MWKRNVFLFFIIPLCLGASFGQALDYAPWFGRSFEIQGRLSSILQTYPAVSAKGSSSYSSTDLFLNGSVAVPLLDLISAEIEGGLLHTRHHPFGGDHLTFLGRYLWVDDTVGDFASITSGLAITQVFQPGLNNISVFHHGGIEVEAHVAYGNEIVCEEFWTSRAWGIVGLGIGDHGAPWIRANLQWDNNCWDRHQWSCFIRSLWGLGARDLRVRAFHGYGSVQHQSVDCGASYEYVLPATSLVKLEGAFRVYARNAPRLATHLVASFIYPFGI